MSLESFFHELALRQASADRDNLKLQPPWWRRRLATASRTTKRVLAATAVMMLAATGWWLRQPIREYLLTRPDHPPGAADVLATVARHVSPLERAHREVLACAREGDAHGCMVALWKALTMDSSKDHVRAVSLWLGEKEVQALRVNVYFDRFATGMEQHPDRVQPPGARPKTSAWLPSQNSKNQPSPSPPLP